MLVKPFRRSRLWASMTAVIRLFWWDLLSTELISSQTNILVTSHLSCFSVTPSCCSTVRKMLMRRNKSEVKKHAKNKISNMGTVYSNCNKNWWEKKEKTILHSKLFYTQSNHIGSHLGQIMYNTEAIWGQCHLPIWSASPDGTHLGKLTGCKGDLVVRICYSCVSFAPSVFH